MYQWVQVGWLFEPPHQKKCQCICSSFRKNVSEMFRPLPKNCQSALTFENVNFFFRQSPGPRVRTDRYAVEPLPRRREHLTDIFLGVGREANSH